MDQANPRISIHALAYELGEPRLIDGLEPFRRSPERLREFQKMGMENYCCSPSADAVELARRSVQKTLRAASLPADRIDVVLYCSENVAITPDGTRRFHRLLHELGLVNAYPIGVHLSNSSNAATLFRVAMSLIRSGEAKSSLLVLADVAKSEAERVMEPALAVIGDGAASCIVSSEVEGQFELLRVVQSASHPSDEARRASLDSLKMRIKANQRLLREQGLSPSSFAHAVTNNYGLSVLEGFASITGIPLSRVYIDNVKKLGHVASADPWINIADLQASGAIEQGSLIMMITSSQYTCGFSVLRAGPPNCQPAASCRDS